MNVSNDNTNIFQKAACSAAGVYVANKLPKFVRKNNPLIKPAIKAMDSISVPKKQMDVFIHLMLNEPVLKKSNFKAVEVTSKNVKDLSNSFTEKLFKFSKNDKNLEKIRDIYQKKILKLFKLVEKGKNAFYSPIDNDDTYLKECNIFGSNWGIGNILLCIIFAIAILIILSFVIMGSNKQEDIIDKNMNMDLKEN